jgi:hypothetical protein
MIHTANRNTARVTVVSPSPNRIIRIGTSAESGAETKTLTHIPSRRSAAFERPIRMPSGTPTRIASAMPTAKDRRVMRVASQNDGFAKSSPSAASTSVNGGRRKTRPRRPTISHSTHQIRSEAIIGTSYPRIRMAAHSTNSRSTCQMSSTVSR